MINIKTLKNFEASVKLICLVYLKFTHELQYIQPMEVLFHGIFIPFVVNN